MDSGVLGTIFAIFFVAIILAVIICLYVIVGKMANKRGRNAAGYIILSLFTSPFIVMIILAILGETDDKREERIIEEEEIRNRIRNSTINKGE